MTTPTSCVFWDTDDFPIPPGRSIYSLYTNIESALSNEGCLGGVKINPYVDMITKDHFRDEIRLRPMDKCERPQNMMIDVLLWVLDNPATCHEPKYLILISKKMVGKDTDFANVLEVLTNRNRYLEVFLIVSDDCVPNDVPLPTIASLVWRWTSLFDGGNPMDFEDGDDDDDTTDCEAEGSSQVDKDTDSSHSTLGVFWDVEDFPLPIRYKMDSFRENIKSALDFDSEMSIFAYADKETVSDELADPKVALYSREDKDARLYKMLFDIFLWAMDNPPDRDFTQNPSIVMIIVKDLTEKLRYVAECLHWRFFNVVLVQHDEFVSEEEVYVNAMWLWKSLLVGGKPLWSGNTC